MFYPAEFKLKVMKLVPTTPELRQALDNGDDISFHLSNAISKALINYQQLATSSASRSTLKKEGKYILNLVTLYVEWMEKYKNN